MSDKDIKARGAGLLWLAAPVSILMFASVSALATSAAIGSVAATTNTTMGGQPLLAGSAIFSGDTLEVKNGAAEIVLSDGSRLVFGRDTEVSFLQEGDAVTALLGQGNVVLYHPRVGSELRVKANDVLIAPAMEFKTVGEVAMLNGGVIVTSREGLLRVEGNGPPVEVLKGKTITIGLNTARTPQGAPAGAGHAGSGSGKLMPMTALGVGTFGTVVSFVGLSRANSASASANRANTVATAASNAAVAAANAAAAATSAAQAATSLATLVAAASLAEVNVVGCELDALANSVGKASPYTPPPGFKCP